MSEEEKKNESSKEIEVFTSLMPQDASMAYTILENAGIKARVEDNVPGYGIGASLMVWEEDAERAIEELKAAGYIVDPEVSNEQMEHDLAGERKSHNRKLWIIIVLILLCLAIYAFFVSKVGA